MQTTTASSVPYGSLIAATEINAREKAGYDKDSIAELAALIEAKGLLQPIVVRAAAAGKFEIMAGKRRYLAIGTLVKKGTWPVGQDVPVVVRDEDDDEALETSLIENIARQAMHPVQEYRVFAAINGNGKDVVTIAKRYGVTVKIVKQRLALGALAPEILKAWEQDKIDADTAEAFAVCPDKKRQVKVFKELVRCQYFDARSVRRLLLETSVRINDVRVAFVGLDTYKAAGGKVVESLFGDDGYLEDAGLLDELTTTKLRETCDQLIADGWAWAVPGSELNANEHYAWAQLPSRKSYMPEEKARIKEISAALDAMDHAEVEDYDEEERDRLEAEKDAIEEAAALRGYSAKQRKESGCVIVLDGTTVSIRAGLLRGKTPAQLEKEKAKAKAKTATDAAADGDEPPAEDQGPHLSQALLADITAAQTKALCAALAQSPQLAIRVAAAALMANAGWNECLPVRLKTDGMARNWENNEDRPSTLADALELVPQANAASVLAVQLGRALDVRQIKFKEVKPDDVAALVGLFPGALYLKAMRAEFDAADYFTRASAQVAVSALEEMAVTDFDRKAKKPVLAQTAAEHAAQRGWLPKELRHGDYALLGGSKRKAA